MEIRRRKSSLFRRDLFLISGRSIRRYKARVAWEPGCTHRPCYLSLRCLPRPRTDTHPDQTLGPEAPPVPEHKQMVWALWLFVQSTLPEPSSRPPTRLLMTTRIQ